MRIGKTTTSFFMARVILGYFGFDKTVYGSIYGSRITEIGKWRWLRELRQEKQELLK
jgi:hypothetical protein